MSFSIFLLKMLSCQVQFKRFHKDCLQWSQPLLNLHQKRKKRNFKINNQEKISIMMILGGSIEGTSLRVFHELGVLVYLTR